MESHNFPLSDKSDDPKNLPETTMFLKVLRAVAVFLSIGFTSTTSHAYFIEFLETSSSSLQVKSDDNLLFLDVQMIASDHWHVNVFPMIPAHITGVSAPQITWRDPEDPRAGNVLTVAGNASLFYFDIKSDVPDVCAPLPASCGADALPSLAEIDLVPIDRQGAPQETRKGEYLLVFRDQTDGNAVPAPSVSAVPAPATLLLVGVGLAGLGWSRRRGRG
jgi:hypothetical protein